MNYKDLFADPVFNESVTLENGLLISAPKGKMTNVMTLTTCATINMNCIKRSKIVGAVCEYCFAIESLGWKESVRKAYEKNTYILTNTILDDYTINCIVKLCIYFNIKYFRFESHGDLNNKIQLINYFNISRALESIGVKTALWTKELLILKSIEVLYKNTGLKEYQKPENMTIIASSLFLNDNNLSIECAYVDKVFTVYTYDYIIENDININCGSRDCFGCGLCYAKIENGSYYVNECLKSDISKLEKYYAMLKRDYQTYKITYSVNGCKGDYILKSRWNSSDKFERSQLIKELANELKYNCGYIESEDDLFNIRIYKK